uniref:Putative galactokinase protein n=1 Tax=Rhizophora mucronata TaxID=61149 RepID=A0A2P2K6M0_RHIMU
MKATIAVVSCMSAGTDGQVHVPECTHKNYYTNILADVIMNHVEDLNKYLFILQC